jgi:murein DD-endopeptidase MepM/ murein hydrolase activator NlpD
MGGYAKLPKVSSSGKVGDSLKWSTGGYTVTSRQGNRTDPITGQKNKPHNGMDIGTPKGTPIGANVSGTVVFAGVGSKKNGYNELGNAVAIKDANGNVHVYGHMDSVNVKSGQKVSSGVVLGKAGSTGKSTGPHLHYEVRKNGVYGNFLDPRNYTQLG